MKTITLHFERIIVEAEEGETLGDVMRHVGGLVDELRARPRGELTSVDVDPPDVLTGAVVMYRTESKHELEGLGL